MIKLNIYIFRGQDDPAVFDAHITTDEGSILFGHGNTPYMATRDLIYKLEDNNDYFKEG